MYSTITTHKPLSNNNAANECYVNVALDEDTAEEGLNR